VGACMRTAVGGSNRVRATSATGPADASAVDYTGRPIGPLRLARAMLLNVVGGRLHPGRSGGALADGLADGRVLRGAWATKTQMRSTWHWSRPRRSAAWPGPGLFSRTHGASRCGCR